MGDGAGEMDVLEKLMEFGMTRQEASLYICLYQGGELTGYEVAKQTGISRSNVYGGLSELVDIGAAHRIEGSPSRYVAVAVEEFCGNKIRALMKEREWLAKNMPAMEELSEGYITIDGAVNIRNKIINMLKGAEQRIYLSAPESFIREIKCDLEAAVARRIKLVLVTDQDTGIDNAIQYLTDKKEEQIRLIIDSVYVLTGDIGGKKTDTCLYSGQKNFVNVFKEALRNEIKLIELTRGEKEDEQQ